MNLYFLQGLSRKTVKTDLHVRINHAYPPRNGHQKVPEDSRGHHTKARAKGLPCGADQPHLQARRPMGSPISLRVAMSVLHDLLGCIYAVL